ncbi:hypothetical protein [Magnetospirillum sp. 15-1]|uniref:3'-5' exonuclease n=1 Tax=Magnetospirillum sp. 15-1 TaxID=1979370 RepID=UPI000BBC8057|nr:hypothetical protein [Magnetospirillum sp. 15-1]
MIFIDVEASGLHPTSYPVEVAWVSHDLQQGWPALIRPASAWGELDWNAESGRIHGISRHQLVMTGMDVREVAARLNADLAGAEVLSDSPGTDGRWLQTLYGTTGIAPAFRISQSPDVQAVIAEACQRTGIQAEDHERLAAALHAEAGLITHRALDDAIGHAFSLGAVTLLNMALSREEVEIRAFRQQLVERARGLLRQYGRGAS